MSKEKTTVTVNLNDILAEVLPPPRERPKAAVTGLVEDEYPREPERPVAPPVEPTVEAFTITGVTIYAPDHVLVWYGAAPQWHALTGIAAEHVSAYYHWLADAPPGFQRQVPHHQVSPRPWTFRMRGTEVLGLVVSN